MDSTPKILAFAGSAREGSLNKRLVRAAADAARALGAEVTLVDLRDYPIPLYDGDAEGADGQPENAEKLKALFAASDGLLIASPEYNSSLSPLLKNTIDWVTRPKGPGEAFGGKTAALLAASPGALGGLRGLNHLRDILCNIGVVVLPGSVAVPKAHEVFDEEGRLTDEPTRTRIESTAAALVTHLTR